MLDQNDNQIEINRNFLAIMDRLGAQDSTLKSILEQTTKTNGRLTKVEDKVEVLQIHHSKQKGYIAGVAAVGSTIIVALWEVAKVMFGHE